MVIKIVVGDSDGSVNVDKDDGGDNQLILRIN